MWKYKQLKLRNKPTFENRIIMANFILYKLTESRFDEDLWALVNWFCQIYFHPLGDGGVSISARADWHNF